MGKFEKFVFGACTLVELGSIIGLAGLALKRNQECYEAECKNIELSCDLIKKEIDMMSKDREIKNLEQEVEDLKNKYESTEEEA